VRHRLNSRKSAESAGGAALEPPTHGGGPTRSAKEQARPITEK
jgi:hypothetical protein